MAMNDKTFSEALTFTRASTKWVWDGTGQLVEVPVDQPAYDHDPVTGEALGVLIEPGATNLLTRSQDFSAWELYTTEDYTPDYASAPDGSMTAYRFNPAFETDPGTSSRNSELRIRTDTAAGTFTASIYVKPIVAVSRYPNPPDTTEEDRDVTLGFRCDLSDDQSGDTETYVTWFNLNTKSVEYLPPHIEAEMVPVGGGWYRCSVTHTATIGKTTNNQRFFFANRAHGTSPSSWSFDPYPSGEEDIYIWGAQVEKGPVATSYIPTAGAAVTRAGDKLSRALGAEFNRVAGTLCGSFVKGSVAGPVSSIVITSPSNSDRYAFFLDSSQSPTGNSALVTVDTEEGGRVYSKALGLLAEGETYKFAISYSEGAFVFALNGVSYESPISHNPVGLSRISFPRREVLIDMEYYPYAMSASELEALTAL